MQKTKKIMIFILFLVLLIINIFIILYHNSLSYYSIKQSKQTILQNHAFENYYDVKYNYSGNSTEIKINNSCIRIRNATGESMKPFFDNNTLLIVDSCFPNNKLKIGDIVIYQQEWSENKNIYHRIVDIDYEKEWIQTKGDNNNVKDDFVGFKRIKCKVIGFLNVLRDKRLINETLPHTEIP